MSALVCGKRSSADFFEFDDQFLASPPSSKRFRCAADLSPSSQYPSLNQDEVIDALDQKVVNQSDGDTALQDQSAASNLPTNGSEWVELFVREMMAASNMDDARTRVSQGLELLEKSIVARAGADARESFYKENMLQKEQVEVLLKDNSILKQAVGIQHRRLKELDERNQELQQLKQLASQYVEQLRTVKLENYELKLRLRQAEQSIPILGRFHPDVF